MTQNIFVNLPVKDLQKSVAFLLPLATVSTSNSPMKRQVA